MSRNEGPSGVDQRPVIHVGERPLRVDDVLAVADGRARIALDPAPECRARLRASVDFLADELARTASVYGVTTGVGASVTTAIAPEHTASLPLNLLRFHGCGVGPVLDPTAAAAVIAVRLASLARGHSAVREEVLERLCLLLAHRVLPRIPAWGSLGASGDLTPLSYVAAVLVGEREVTVGGDVVATAEALRALAVAPLTLLHKESLALMNGTSVLTALGCLGWRCARRLARLSAALTAATSDVVHGNAGHFDARIFALKPHLGLVTAGRWIREDLALDGGRAAPPARLQDRYSIRCAPHVIGVLVDACDQVEAVLETEINSVNDNPIVDAELGAILHGGNFYAGHVGFVLDGLKVALASVADMLDRQLVLLCDPASNGGLPANLVAVSGPERTTHHGFKALSIGASALTAEALKLTMPASAFSRSSEAHNQDKVPMANHAARDCLAVLDLLEPVAAMLTLAVAQACDLRSEAACCGRTRALRAAVRRHVPMLEADRRMDHDIERVVALLAEDQLPFGAWA